MRARVASLALWSTVALVACARVRSCGKRVATPVAVMEVAHGRVEHGHGAPYAWSASNAGDPFALGDSVRTGVAASARVRLVTGGGIHLGQNTVVRFSAHPLGPGRASVRVVTGEAEVDSASEPVLAETDIGTARIEHGARVRLVATASGAQLQVYVGRAQFEQPGMLPIEAGAGECVEASIAGAIIEDVATGRRRHVALVPRVDGGARAQGQLPAADAAVVAVAHSTTDAAVTAASDAATAGQPADGGTTPTTASSARPDAPPEAGAIAHGIEPGVSADVTVDAGDSLMIHDSAPSTAVRISLERACPEGPARIELLGSTPSGSIEGTGQVTFVMRTSSYRYRVRCIDARGGHAIEGRIRRSGDLGAASMPRTAPHTTVDADGRRYTVLFQNRLPGITFRWVHAPAASGYVLQVRGPSGQPVNVPSREPSTELPSGRLPEGTYRFRFQAQDMAAHSLDTTLVIDFDNAARAAQIREPGESAHVEGGRIHVSGTAAPASVVVANGQSLPLDDQLRFQGSVPASGEGAALVIRISHRTLGVHAYVRRAGTQ
ncbi:MAG: hypothetical protein WCJ30_11430 [Deltaproteobacteria bacterium]